MSVPTEWPSRSVRLKKFLLKIRLANPSSARPARGQMAGDLRQDDGWGLFMGVGCTGDFVQEAVEVNVRAIHFGDLPAFAQNGDVGAGAHDLLDLRGNKQHRHPIR